MKTRLQEKINLLNIDELNTLNSIARDDTKQQCNDLIESWREQNVVYGYFKAKCDDIYRQRRITNNAILELYIYYCLIMYELDVNDDEQDTFRFLANYYYEDGQRQAGGEPKEITDKLYYDLLRTPCTNGYTLDEYKNATALQHTYQLHRNAVTQIQQGLKPRVRDMDKELNRQLNERLKVGAKISGVIDMLLIGINNMAIVEGIKKVKPTNAKVRFIAVIDDRTTPMCESLNGQIFNVYDNNTFIRWSDAHKQMRRYTCKGLVIGLNLPPITNHFHFCRSTIEYLREP